MVSSRLADNVDFKVLGEENDTGHEVNFFVGNAGEPADFLVSCVTGVFLGDYVGTGDVIARRSF
ncbi:MAG: hypothetical protein WCJ40_12935 [Planctomycetota bacterium]